MNKKLIALLILCLPLFSHSAEISINPGMWETTVTRTNPMTGKPTTETNRECLKEKTFRPSEIMQDMKDCTLTEEQVAGNTLTFKMACDMQGMSSSVEGRYQSNGDSGTGMMKMNMNMGGMELNMTVDWKGEKVGEC